MRSRPQCVPLFVIGVLGVLLFGGALIFDIATDRRDYLWMRVGSLLLSIGNTYIGWRGPLFK